MSTADPPKAPTGLRAPGRRLWNSVVDVYVLTAGEIGVLEQACRASDLCARLEKAVHDLPELTAPGYRDQPRPHPLLGQLRAQQLLLQHLIGGLNLPDDSRPEVGMTPASRHAQHAAQARWRRRKEPDHGETTQSAFHPNAS